MRTFVAFLAETGKLDEIHDLPRKGEVAAGTETPYQAYLRKRREAEFGADGDKPRDAGEEKVMLAMRDRKMYAKKK